MDFLKSLPWKEIALGTATVLVGTVAWEHAAKKKGWTVRPSQGLTEASNASQAAFKKVGEKAAQLSSYLTLIDMKKVKEALGEVGKSTEEVFGPITGVVLSPAYIAVGYFQTAYEYGKKRQWLVYTGSAVVIIMVVSGGFWVAGYDFRSQIGFFKSLAKSGIKRIKN